MQKVIVMKQSENIEQVDGEIDFLETRLRGDQSVRATFRLPRELIEALEHLAGEFGVKRKSLFDQLVEGSGMLDEVADSIASMNRESGGQRRPTTFVVSKRFLQAVQQIVKAKCIQRDILVEALIRRSLPLLFAAAKRNRKAE